MKHIKQGDFIKHERFLDTAIRVRKIRHFPPYVEIQGGWVNLGFDKSYDINLKVKLKFKAEELKDWRLCSDSTVHPSLRKCPWEGIA